jgi:hypothetical protein
MGEMRLRPRSKLSIPEPSHRIAIWFAAIAIIAFGIILGYEYAVGDPRLLRIAASLK